MYRLELCVLYLLHFEVRGGLGREILFCGGRETKLFEFIFTDRSFSSLAIRVEGIALDFKTWASQPGPDWSGLAELKTPGHLESDSKTLFSLLILPRTKTKTCQSNQISWKFDSPNLTLLNSTTLEIENFDSFELTYFYWHSNLTCCCIGIRWLQWWIGQSSLLAANCYLACHQARINESTRLARPSNEKNKFIEFK